MTASVAPFPIPPATREPDAVGLAPGRARVISLDLVRGLVMVLMALDHVRVYSGVPAGGPTAGVFLTRWVTHFCAPAFVFLAGTAAYLHGQKLADRAALVRYLATRGALLVVLELTVIRASWTYGVDYSRFLLAGVIWMLGWCMILMAGLVRLRTAIIGTLGLAIIFGQDLFGVLAGTTPPSLRWVWRFLYQGGEVPLGPNGPTVSVLYSILPWIGVMAAGYAFGSVMKRSSADRRRICLRIGLGATILFLVAGGLAVALSPAPDNDMPAVLRLLNQRKYPASQLFLLMTLGPTIAVLPLLERAGGRLAEVLATFGRVPLFYYLLHIPVIHALALGVWWLRDGAVHPAWFATAPYVSVPDGARWSLLVLYLVFATAMLVLYPFSRWFASFKARRSDAWLRYL